MDGDVLTAAALAVENADDLIVATVRDVHGAVADRVHRGLRPVRVDRLVAPIHDGIATTVYAGVSTGLRLSAGGLRAAGSIGIAPRLEATGTGRFAIAAVNGLIGDQLVMEEPTLAIDAGVRRAGRDVPLDPEAVAAAFPSASDAVVVFVHGLCETERYWHRRSRPRREDGTSSPSYGERLEQDEGWTPVDLRVNTGLSVAESGVAVRSLMTRLVAAWPVPVRRIALVGHSMGGLIVRAATAVDTGADEDWTSLLTDIVTLGTPHLGSPVERAIERGAEVGSGLAETAPIAAILRRRSRGVRDLHDGMPEVAVPLAGVRYLLVAATLAGRTGTVASDLFGDLLVSYRSATGRPRGGSPLFPGATILHVPRADHFDLLNHDTVYEALRRQLAR